MGGAAEIRMALSAKVRSASVSDAQVLVPDILVNFNDGPKSCVILYSKAW